MYSNIMLFVATLVRMCTDMATLVHIRTDMATLVRMRTDSILVCACTVSVHASPENKIAAICL